MIEYNFRLSISLQFNDDAHALTRTFVADIRYAFNSFLAHHVGNFFDHGGLGDLIRNLRDNQRQTILADGLGFHARTHDDRTAPCRECASDSSTAEDNGTCREIWSWNNRQQVFDCDVRVFHHRQSGVDDFTQIMGCHVGGHAHGNAACPVDQQVWVFRGKDLRFAEFVGVVELKIHRVLVEVVEQRHGGFGEAGFRITVSGWRVSVYRTEVTLAIDERQPQ